MENNIIRNKIKEIQQSIDIGAIRDHSFLKGKAGILLFLAALQNSQIIEGDSYSSDIENLANDIIGNERMTQHNTLAGFAGVHFVFSMMHSYDLIDEADFSNFSLSSSLKQGLSMLREGFYDYIHGGIGDGYMALRDPASVARYREYIEEYLDVINYLLINNNGLIYRNDFDKCVIDPTKMNLGLAHGVPSIIKFCVQCYKKGISKELSYRNAMTLIEYIINHQSANGGRSYFPYEVNLDAPEKISDEVTRLGWCYGDLTIAYMLYQAGAAFENQEITSLGLEVLKHTSKRRTFEETKVLDAGICHGSAGISHIYNRMWRFTDDPVFKEAADFWLQRTLELARYEDGIAGYKRFNPFTKEYDISYGLLEGAAGIGLVLMSHLTGDFSWDYFLMLND